MSLIGWGGLHAQAEHELAEFCDDIVGQADGVWTVHDRHATYKKSHELSGIGAGHNYIGHWSRPTVSARCMLGIAAAVFMMICYHSRRRVPGWRTFVTMTGSSP